MPEFEPRTTASSAAMLIAHHYTTSDMILKRPALAGNRTRVNCLEGSYAHHYTTNAYSPRAIIVNLNCHEI